MERHFAQLLEKVTPKFNSDIVSGLAWSHMKYSESYIDAVMRSSNESLPNGFKYLGYERLTPKEEYLAITRLKDNKYAYEMAHSDLYMMRYNFEFNGEPIPRLLYLPFVTKGGLFRSSGTLWHISPVLTDRVITPNHTDVFVRLLRDKLMFKRIYYSVNINNEKRPLQVIWSNIYKNNKNKNAAARMNSTTKAETCIVHYLLAKVGMTEMFKRFLGFIPVVGENEITRERYPESDWVICETTKAVPKGWRGSKYVPHNIKFAIPKENWNIFTENVIAGMFYVLDHFPEYVGLDMLDDTKMWMILLGHINFSGNYSMEKLYSSIEEHFITVDSYIDNIIKEKLKTSTLIDPKDKINDFYDLLAIILKNFSEWVIHSKEYTNSIYNRYLDVNYYVLYTITSGIFKANYELTHTSGKKELTVKSINDIFHRNLSPGRIYKLVKTTNINIALSAVDYSGDNMYPKITSIVALQESGNGVERAKRSGLPESSRYLTGPDLALGSVLFLTKKLPTPKVRVNPFANIDIETGVINPEPKIKQALDVLNQMLDGKNPNDIILEE